MGAFLLRDRMMEMGVYLSDGTFRTTRHVQWRPTGKSTRA